MRKSAEIRYKFDATYDMIGARLCMKNILSP